MSISQLNLCGNDKIVWTMLAGLTGLGLNFERVHPYTHTYNLFETPIRLWKVYFKYDSEHPKCLNATGYLPSKSPVSATIVVTCLSSCKTDIFCFFKERSLPIRFRAVDNIPNISILIVSNDKVYINIENTIFI